ncbi:hypothetical protein D3C75_1235750 [compost metagenome]
MDDALRMSSEFAGSNAGMTSGNIEPKISTTAATMTTADQTNAQPSRRARVVSTTSTSATAATATTAQVHATE